MVRTEVLERISQLINAGRSLHSRSRGDYWMADVTAAQGWMASAANAIQQVTSPGSFYRQELDRLMANDELRSGIPEHIIAKVLGVLESVHSEAQAGMLQRLEDQVAATAFDDFLDHASDYHKSGKLREAAVLASAVLEDAVKRVGAKNQAKTAAVSLDPLIDDLTSRGVFTAVKAKRLKSYAGVRNHALHAEWDKLDLKDVGAMISGVRELLDEHL
jgi:uncharacterized protein YutE (UPF0331/DUF86 family)